MTVPANHSDKDVPADLRMVEISREPVELYKILKFEGMVTSGGQAKAVVAAGQVLVNGKIETRKRKKIVAGDTLEFEGQKIGIKLALTVAGESPPPKSEAIEEAIGGSVAVEREKE